jgi:hypothetical protein
MVRRAIAFWVEKEEIFLYARADAFAGAKAEDKVGLLRSE